MGCNFLLFFPRYFPLCKRRIIFSRMIFLLWLCMTLVDIGIIGLLFSVFLFLLFFWWLWGKKKSGSAREETNTDNAFDNNMRVGGCDVAVRAGSRSVTRLAGTTAQLQNSIRDRFCVRGTSPGGLTDGNRKLLVLPFCQRWMLCRVEPLSHFAFDSMTYTDSWINTCAHSTKPMHWG